MTKLDEVALNVELVLISIIEGVALTNLGENAVPLLRDLNNLQYIPYILAGLAILLVFWAQAILHAVSFIRWPLKMEHMLLYFLAAFLQIIAYSTITDGVLWYFWWTVFSILALFIYVVDLRVIKDSEQNFAPLPGGTEYIKEIERRHMFEIKYLIPVALAFNIIALLLMYGEPQLFLDPWWYAGLGTLQFVVSLGALVDCVKNFKARSAMLPSLFK